jgi:hypothetical protein
MRFYGTKRADGVYTPLVEVEFRFPGDPRTPLALVDSGADRTMLPAEFLPASVPYESLTVLGTGRGVGGEFEIRRCDHEVWFQKWKVCGVFIVIEPGKMPDPTVLLGRLDFMKRFTVSFDWHEERGTFDIKPIKK